MIIPTEFAGKRVAVLGLARSGMAAAEVLKRLGAQVSLYDKKPTAELAGALETARLLGLTVAGDGVPIDFSGLDYLVTSPGVPKNSPSLTAAVEAGVQVLSEIEAAYRIARAPILAVTGTNGKTTTAVLTAEMLRAGGVSTYVAGNVAAGEIALPLIKAAVDADPGSAIVAEISSFQLEWVSTFKPRVAALLNITEDHGDRQTWDEYVAAKWNIFAHQTEEDNAILSSEMTSYPRFASVRSKVTVFDDPAYQVALLSDDELDRTLLPGNHNRANILASAAMARAFGIEHDAIVRAVASFTGVVHRLEYVGEIDGVRYVNNSMCTNVAAFQKSLEALPGPKVVIMGGVFKGGDKSGLVSAVRANNVEELILIGRSAPDLEAAMIDGGYSHTHLADSLQAAVTSASALAQSGSTVLLAPACASFDMFKDFEDRGDQFKDAVVKLKGRKGESR
jgi:UDP-N-acetylmuramoylalanine--D-glutamate ligase